MLSTVFVPVIIAVIGAGGGIVAALITRPRRPPADVPPEEADPQDPQPNPPPPEPIGLAAFISGLAFMCSSIVVGLALALGKPPSAALMLTLGTAGGLLAAVAGQRAYRAVRQSEQEDRGLGYGVMLAAFCAFIAILIVG
jgi:hypothetical protein